jgi:hypothetical protein
VFAAGALVPPGLLAQNGRDALFLFWIGESFCNFFGVAISETLADFKQNLWNDHWVNDSTGVNQTYPHVLVNL